MYISAKPQSLYEENYSLLSIFVHTATVNV